MIANNRDGKYKKSSFLLSENIPVENEIDRLPTIVACIMTVVLEWKRITFDFCPADYNFV